MSLDQIADIYGYDQIPSFMWRCTKELFSPSYRQACYEERAECIILLAYEMDASLKASDPHDPALSGILDEIMEFKDSPKYAKHSVENTGYLNHLSLRLREATIGFTHKYPELHIERIKRHITRLYGHEELDDDVVRDRTVWQRIWDVRDEKRKEYVKSKGLDFLHIVTSYESRIDIHQFTIASVIQVEQEGLIDATKLFSKSGNHGSVSRDVEAFDRVLYAEWESTLKPMTEKEKRIEFREFVGQSTKIWGKEYLQWLKTR